MVKQIMPNKSLILLMSYHHKNTEKIAKTIANVIDAQIKSPQQISPDEIAQYDLIGFGSGIYDGHHHKKLLDFADQLPQVKNKKAFLFSTFGAPKLIANREFVLKNHLILKEKLLKKGFQVIEEFGCAGFNTNSFLVKFGGLNKG
ncbi:MAG: flavodoxin, partial [Thermoclostridium sp.]|nr:flavodoxin [Thermoclostridium sp.]